MNLKNTYYMVLELDTIYIFKAALEFKTTYRPFLQSFTLHTACSFHRNTGATLLRSNVHKLDCRESMPSELWNEMKYRNTLGRIQGTVDFMSG